MSELTPDLLNRPELLRETLLGINKSFAEAGVENAVALSPAVSFESLIEMLLPLLRDLFFKKPGQFKLLLYRVDISEDVFKRNTEAKTSEDFLPVIAALIIKRELQKAVFRRLYRDNNNSSKPFKDEE
jgi:hypothetical protein